MNASDQTQCEKCVTPLNGEASANPPEPKPSQKGAGGTNVVNQTVIGRKANIAAWDDSVPAKPQSPHPKNNPNPERPPVPESPNAKKGRNTEDLGRKNMLICPSCRYMNTSMADACVNCGISLVGDKSNLNETKLADPPRPVSAGRQPNPVIDEKQTNINSEEEFSHKQTSRKDTPPPSPNFNATVNPWNQRKTQNFTLRPISREGEQLKVELPFEGDSVELNRANLEPSNTSITSKLQALIEYREGVWYLMNSSAQQTTFIRVEGAVQIKKGDVILLGDRLFEFDC